MMIHKSVAKDALPQQQDYFVVQRFCFSCIGIDPTSLESTYSSYIRCWLPMLSMVALSILMALYAIQNIHDLDAVTDSLSPFWQSILAIFKFMYFMWTRRKLITFIRKFWLWNLKAEGAEHVIVTAENRKDKFFCTFYLSSTLITGGLALLAPFLIAGYYSLHGKSFWEDLEQPFKAAYFGVEKTLWGYIIAYTVNLLSINHIIFASLAIDSLFSWFMCNIVAQFRILKHRIRNAAAENSGHCSLQSITDCIAYHCRIIEIAKEFNDIFSVVIFLKFMISGIQICCLAFRLSRGGELTDQLFCWFFFISVAAQLILYCYGGQRIQDESESVADQIYESFRWDLLPVTTKKILILTMLRAQKPCNLSGIFFNADLRLYLWVYRTAASFITLLWTVEEQLEETQ